MDKFLRVCGIIFLVLLGIGFVLGAIFIPRAMILNSSAVAFIDQELPKIAANWDPDVVLRNGTAEFSSAATKEQIDLLWAKFRQLGKLQSHDEPRGNVGAQAMSNGPSGTFGMYSVRADFEHGNADIKITLKRVGDGWKFYGFHINSDIFLK